MDKTEIYCITNKITGKKYIGQGACMYYDKKRKHFRKTGALHRWNNHNWVADNTEEKEGKKLRLIIASLKEYGQENHELQILETCDSSIASDREVQLIAELNTQKPNGLNILPGGKCSPLTDELKEEISKRTKGKGNPMYGKHHKQSTKEKISQHHKGKALPESQKKNMSKAHVKNTTEGKMPPRRKHTELPKYIYHVTSSNKEGYEIRHHPKLRAKQFVSTALTMEERLQKAKAYLADENNPAYQKEKREYKEYKDLPRYVRQFKSERYEGLK
jgi:group I intron endonuclease